MSALQQEIEYSVNEFLSELKDSVEKTLDQFRKQDKVLLFTLKGSNIQLKAVDKADSSLHDKSSGILTQYTFIKESLKIPEDIELPYISKVIGNVLRACVYTSDPIEDIFKERVDISILEDVLEAIKSYRKRIEVLGVTPPNVFLSLGVFDQQAIFNSLEEFSIKLSDFFWVSTEEDKDDRSK